MPRLWSTSDCRIACSVEVVNVQLGLICSSCRPSARRSSRISCVSATFSSEENWNWDGPKVDRARVKTKNEERADPEEAPEVPRKRWPSVLYLRKRRKIKPGEQCTAEMKARRELNRCSEWRSLSLSLSWWYYLIFIIRSRHIVQKTTRIVTEFLLQIDYSLGWLIWKTCEWEGVLQNAFLETNCSSTWHRIGQIS